MKLNFLGLGLGLLVSAQSLQAKVAPSSVPAIAMKALMQADLAESAANLINWKVGDYQDLQIEFVFGGGDGSKVATKEDKERNAIWLETNMTIMGQKQKTEALFDRATAEVLELIVNGQKQDPKEGGDGEVEIIEQSETKVTVPAGTFECIYIKAKTKSQGQEMIVQLWANPIDVTLDGVLKLSAETAFGDLVISLKKFGNKKL